MNNPHKTSTSEQRFWHLMNPVPPHHAVDGSVSIHSLSEVDINPFRSMLIHRGIPCQDQERASLSLVIVDSMGDPALEAFNQRMLQSGTPFFVLKPIGIEVEYALFTKESACWVCFEKRHRLLDGPATYLYEVLDLEQPVIQPHSFTEGSVTLAYTWALLEIGRLFKGASFARLQGKLHAVQLEHMQTSRHSITRLPHCRACSDKTIPAGFPPTPKINLNQNIIL